MTETPSNVYDLVYSSPISLKEISSVAVAFELWREEIVKCCVNGVNNTSNEFHLVEEIALKNVLPEIPLAIRDELEEHIKKCRLSIAQWLVYHSDILKSYPTWDDVLKHFHDFAYDWNGAIHYVRTAKRVMLCDRLRDEEKFKFACNYCFENDIWRIWPSVSSKINLNEIELNYCPLLVYWVCRLKNELDRVPNQYNEPIDEMMLDKCRSQDWSSVEYFWNRIPPERQLQKAVDLAFDNSEPLARFILPKLNEIQLSEFIAETGSDLICHLYTYGSDKAYVLPTWLFIRNKVDQSNIISLIEKLFEEETNFITAKDRLSPRDEAYICCEIWKSIPDNFKQPVLKYILSRRKLFERQCLQPEELREMKFLITLLLDASTEDRRKFWSKNWSGLISGARGKDLEGIMKLCFENEAEIGQFKRNVMGKYENIHDYCGRLLSFAYYEELNDLLNFCQPDPQIRKELARQLLRNKFLDEDSMLNPGYLSRAKVLNNFIDDAFDNVALATDFKNQFVSSPKTEKVLFISIKWGNFIGLMEFVNTFVTAEQTLVPLKKRLLDSVRSNLIARSVYRIYANELQSILVWFLGSDDEVEEFKRSISVDDIFRNMVKRYSEEGGDEKIRFPHTFDEFLKWYFTSPEEIEDWKKRFSEDLKMFSTESE